MKYSYGKMIKQIFVCIFILTLCCESVVFAGAGSIEFNLTEADCGSAAIQATAGEGVLKASADGVNAEQIRWDTDTAHLFPRMQGKKLATGWAEGGYWLIEFSGTGMKNIRFSAVMYSSGKGPGAFELLYSFDNKDYIKIDGSEVSLSKNAEKVYDGFALPKVIEGRETVFLKIRMCSSISVSGKVITGVKDGSTYINNIAVEYTGEDSPEISEPANPDNPAPGNLGESTDYIKRSRNNYGRATGKYKFTVTPPAKAEVKSAGRRISEACGENVKYAEIRYNGKCVCEKLETALLGGEIFLPVRAFFESMEYTVEWNRNSADISKSGETAVFGAEARNFSVNEEEKKWASEVPVYINDKLYVPSEVIDFMPSLKLSGAEAAGEKIVISITGK